MSVINGLSTVLRPLSPLRGAWLHENQRMDAGLVDYSALFSLDLTPSPDLVSRLKIEYYVIGGEVFEKKASPFKIQQKQYVKGNLKFWSLNFSHGIPEKLIFIFRNKPLSN